MSAIWNEACNFNANGYGIFATVNEMDGFGYGVDGRPLENGVKTDTLEHVASIRAQVVDLDNLNAPQNSQRALQHPMPPQFYVQTSPNKFHVYWTVTTYRDNEWFKTVQRKLRQFYEGDPAVIDATRVLRVPGFYHRKGAPHLVTCYQAPGYGHRCDPGQLAATLAHITAIDDSTTGTRHKLGDPTLAAPSADWLWHALDTMPIDGMSHPEFIAFTAAYKQAGWNVAEPDMLRERWLAWCERFGNDSKGRDYNLKHWDSITDTEIGWKGLLRQNPSLNGAYLFHGAQAVPVRPLPPQPGSVPPQPVPVVPSPQSGSGNAVSPWEAGAHPLNSQYGAILTADECKSWFAGCAFISSTGYMFTPFGTMNQTAFNAKYGGKRFVINPTGAPSDEPWKAATRSVFWTVPKIDYPRFNPNENFGMITEDELGRMAINIYRPAKIATMKGDPSPFLKHLSLVLPDANDQRILVEYLAHNAKYPGHKIPWALLIQSAEGVGKGVFKLIMQHVIGHSYTYFPNAKLLNDSGAKFNGWMDQKLFFVADEIRTDEKRDMVEVLKPIVSEREIELQGKGKDQVQADNPGNWLFFSNHKDAIPINDNSRRFAVFYSAIQSVSDIEARGMNDDYFRALFGWLDADGARAGLKIVADYLMNYRIERGGLPMRAPRTSSHAEAVTAGLGPIASAIMDAIEAEAPGFRGGWINRDMVRDMLKRDYSTQAITKAITDDLGGKLIGRHSTPIIQERGYTPRLFRLGEWRSLQHYMADQGYHG
ncbi:DUF5906 domain-containing protein [Paracoccus shanxieyensis]|uniref:Uncharacterized protein n=1 Tax=Paracoccus shanxieyensis TaxID=2675752 RepID=A0A6L6IXX1_9RHOB|nr:DUF5906 domain-containing protein [Paracoccus shanxieyensis]MTH64729.1 hypothetical protein [Paracoccus shanxieyensis]MTH87873.1 hypothetical protein [Paracoccus shanxieyensis]